MTVLAAASGPGSAQLIAAALIGIAVVVVLITWLKVHPFLSLIIGSLVLGVIAGMGMDKTITSFETGVGSTPFPIAAYTVAKSMSPTSDASRSALLSP